MKVIALYGSGNTGKTSTLQLVISMLINDGAKITKSIPMSLDLNHLFDNGDVKCCLLSNTGKKICITTSGDDGYQQMLNKEFVCHCGEVDVWITASRNYGRSVDTIWDSHPFGVSEVFKVLKTDCFHIYRELWIKQYDWNRVETKQIVDNDHAYCNQHDAKRILRFLKMLI